METNNTNLKSATICHLYVNVIFNYQNKNVSKIFFNKYLKNLTKEIFIFKNKYHCELKTIYIGGKSLRFIDNEQLKLLLETIKNCNLTMITEYSFEYHYGFFNEKTLIILKKYQINRLVWRIQTFNQKLLNKINENINIETVISLIKKSKTAGFNNFSIDLTFQIPGQTLANIYDDLNICLKLIVPHISYESFFDFQEPKIKKVISNFLKTNNYEQYEYFSYAKNEKWYSQQTLAYLTLQNWYGLGPKAYGFYKNNDKQWIIKNTKSFLKWQTIIAETTTLDYYQLILTQGLMLRSGLIINNDSLAAIQHYRFLIDKLIADKQVIIQNNYLKATNIGWLLLNKILTIIINSNCDIK